MIEAVVLQNFKCFARQRVEIGQLTLLTGLNGMGKSSVIQSLLLLRQSAAAAMLPGVGLLLNGDLVRLGTGMDVLFDGADSDSLAIVLQRDGTVQTWAFDVSRGDSDVLPLLNAGPINLAGPPFGAGVQYLSAERMGPRASHAVSSYHVSQLGDTGADGAYAVAFLDARGGESVSEELAHPTAAGPGLGLQVSAWMGEVSPGVRLSTKQSPEVNAASLSVSFSSGRATSNAFRPTSVGFGVSYTLPVLVALLSSKPGGLVLLENPEAHLHPRGQMAMGELMARAAASGVQVLVETHSDHVLNGVRLAVKQGKVRAADVRLHYFSRHDDGERIVHDVASPRIDANGRIDEWPAGFFDQWDIALEKLL
jgi:predicted ATPase